MIRIDGNVNSTVARLFRDATRDTRRWRSRPNSRDFAVLVARAIVSDKIKCRDRASPQVYPPSTGSETFILRANCFRKTIFFQSAPNPSQDNLLPQRDGTRDRKKPRYTRNSVLFSCLFSRFYKEVETRTLQFVTLVRIRNWGEFWETAGERAEISRDKNTTRLLEESSVDYL